MDADLLLDELTALPTLLMPIISRDRAWAAFTWFPVDENPGDVFVARTDGSTGAVRMTRTREFTWLASWTRDRASVIVGEDHDGDERLQLFRVRLDRPFEMEPLTDASPRYYLKDGDLHPNGRWLLYGANYDFDAKREIEPTWLYRHDLRTGERVPLARPERPAWFFPRWNEQGTRVLYARSDIHPAGEQVWMVNADGTEDRELFSAAGERRARGQWLRDGHRVLLVAETATHKRVGVIDVRGGPPRWLIDDPEREIERAFMAEGTDLAVLVEVSAARTHASLLDLNTGRETRLKGGGSSLLPLAPAGDGVWVAQQWGAAQPADLVRVNSERAGDEESITGLWSRTRIRPSDLVEPEDLRWRSVDGLEIQGWVYRARRDAIGTVVWIHGGPTHHDDESVDPLAQYLVARGFNVLQPNYRGSTGFGMAFREAIKADGWGGREQDDIRTGIEALIERGIASPFKVGVTGLSYGGYSSWCQITRCPPAVVAAAAPICGMTDLAIDYESTRPDLRPYSEEMMGGSPQSAPERYLERSPVHYVSNIRGRLLMVHGERDPNVTPENVRAVRTALDHHGVPYELLTFDDEGHGVFRPENRKVLARRLADFFEASFRPG